ncbi:putative quinol monooxygenase [Herbiconiux daphne]|uniref:Antibiotic biosynthesis monooxygenase n=1 Tax=Herbiconiux daphne TaxID=2970914 RepID=A0ABT2H6X6_9MICO|nr:antibiotic biosynthesis monooxygenase [Herbiconiux daphne]MCS5735705.1 antibiotic biosynthesis monooxygenase [Herbiconiux daphne]
MLLITGSASPLPDARDKLIAAAIAVSESTQQDDGCISYTFAAALDGEEIISVELWRDRAALAAHMNHDHTRQFLADLEGVLVEVPVMHETELEV